MAGELTGICRWRRHGRAPCLFEFVGVVNDAYAYVAYLGERHPDVDSGRPKNGLRVLDIRDPTRVVLVGNVVLEVSTSSVVLEGTHVYLVNAASLDIVDVQDPTRPVLVGSYRPDGEVARVAVRGNLAYVVVTDLSPSVGDAGLHVLDVSTPARPRRVGMYQTTIASDPAAGLPPPVITGRLPPPSHPIFVDGDRVYASFDGSEIHVIDVHDPTHPERVSAVGSRTDLGNLGDSRPADITVHDDRVLIAAGLRGLLVWRSQTVPRITGIRPINANQVAVVFASQESDPTRFTVESAPQLRSPVRWVAESLASHVRLRMEGDFEAVVASPGAVTSASAPNVAKFYRVGVRP